MDEKMLARLAEINARAAEDLTDQEKEGLAAARAMDDGTTENINDTIKRHAKTSKAQQEAVRRYVRKSYDRLDLVLPKGQKAEIKEAAANNGESVNGFLSRIISEALAKTRTHAINN